MIKRLFLPLAVVGYLFVSCNKQQYEECSEDRIFGSWGVVNYTHAFGETDSSYYIINPVRDILDSIYYNGNYTDSYYKADDTRVTLRYTCSDSVIFFIDRLYAVESNPMELRVRVVADTDTCDADRTTLRMKRDAKDENIYRCGPDSTFSHMLRRGALLRFFATNTASGSEASGSQNYEWVLYTSGFEKALALADKLNGINRKELKEDTVKKKENILQTIGEDLGVGKQ